MSGLINVRGARSGVLGTVTGTTAAAAAGGITHTNQWRINANQIGTDITPYTDWAELDAMGTSLTVSSGIFTFPVTGYWLIYVQHFGWIGTPGGYVNTILMKTTNNSSYVQAGMTSNTHSAPFNSYVSHHLGPILFDVTDVTQCKVRIDQGATATYTMTWEVDKYDSGATFVRIGDT